MDPSSDGLVCDIVGDFIHSPIWRAPVNTFIEANCAAFDYDEETAEEGDSQASSSTVSPSTSEEEQRQIYQKYQQLVDALIESLGKELSLNQRELQEACQLPSSADSLGIIDESFEQLYAAKDFRLFQEMMRRKNLILQLQALVALQLQWGILKQSDTGDDLILTLLLQATSTSSQFESTRQIPETSVPSQLQHNEKQPSEHNDDDDVVEIKEEARRPTKRKEQSKPKKQSREYSLPEVKSRIGPTVDVEWYRNLSQTKSQDDSDNDDVDGDTSREKNRPKKTPAPQTINAVSEDVLREKLRELSVRTMSSEDKEKTAAVESRKKFLEAQRKLIVDKQRAEHTKNLEQAVPNVRPQSAAHVARKAMATTETKPDNTPTPVSNPELDRRRIMMERLKREVVDKK